MVNTPCSTINYRGRLQFITHKTERYSVLDGAAMALEGSSEEG